MHIAKGHRGLAICILCTALIMFVAATSSLAASAEGQKETPDGKADGASKKAPEGAAKKNAQPPALVVTATARSGQVRPQLEYIGTIYFPEVAQVASEVEGRVEEYFFEEGGSVTKGQELVRLNTDLVEKDLESAQFEYKNLATQLDNAKRELNRIRALFEKKTVSAQDFDRAYYLVAGLENRVVSLKAQSGRLQLQYDKSRVKAPFDGIVLSRSVSRGEWLNRGTPVATLARNDMVDILVHVPQKVLPFLQVGMKLPATTGSKKLKAEVHALIPEGDVATRTFPIKLRAPNDGLAQGMEARVGIPSGKAEQAVLIPRDGVLMNMGNTSIWVVVDGHAVNIPVVVTAYQDFDAAVQSLSPETPLQEGMQVVVKGNERLRPGQNVKISGHMDAPSDQKSTTPAQKTEQ